MMKAGGTDHDFSTGTLTDSRVGHDLALLVGFEFLDRNELAFFLSVLSSEFESFPRSRGRGSPEQTGRRIERRCLTNASFVHSPICSR